MNVASTPRVTKSIATPFLCFRASSCRVINRVASHLHLRLEMLHFLRYALCVSQHNEALALTAGCARRSDSLHVSRLVPRTKRRWASDEARSEKLAGHITPGHKGFRASRWTDDKDSALRAAVADGLTDARIAADVLPGRTLQAIGKRRSSLKLGHFTLSDTASAEFVKRAQDRLRGMPCLEVRYEECNY